MCNIYNRIWTIHIIEYGQYTYDNNMDNICIYVLSVRWGGEMAVPSRGETLTVAPVPLETRQERGHILVPLSSGVIGTVRHCSVIPHYAPYGLSIR